MYVDFEELENYTVETSTTVSKVIDNIIKLENDDVFIADENMEYSVSELDDVVVFKQIIDKYTWMRLADSYSRIINTVGQDKQLEIGIESIQDRLNETGDKVTELYKLVINDTIYEVDKKE